MVLLRSFSPPNEDIELKLENTSAHVLSGDLGNGTLFIAHRCLVWQNTNGQGFSLEYPSITLHAVSRDTSSFPHQCLYLMLDASLGKCAGPKHLPAEFGGEKDEESDDETPEDESETVREVRFVPQDINSLDAMYKALANCQRLHPDPEDEQSDDEAYEDEGNEDTPYESLGSDALQSGQFFTDASGLENLTPQGRATLSHLMNVMEIQEPGGQGQTQQSAVTNGSGDAQSSEQFDDADDMEQS